MFANSQCLLRMSSGIDFPSFQLNWRYPAAIEARVDFLDRVEVGMLALSTKDLIPPNM